MSFLSISVKACLFFAGNFKSEVMIEVLWMCRNGVMLNAGNSGSAEHLYSWNIPNPSKTTLTLICYKGSPRNYYQNRKATLYKEIPLFALQKISGLWTIPL